MDPHAEAVVQRMFRMADSGHSVLDITKALNDEGVASPRGKRWSKTAVHLILKNEIYTGTLVWGATVRHKAPPVRVEGAVPTIVSAEQFHRVAGLLQSRAPAKVHPRRVSSPYVLSGLVKCKRCNRALTGQESKSGRFAYYVCQSLLKRGSGVCDAPRLNAKRFERLIVDQIRDNVLTERNIRDLVKLLDEEMDGLAHEHRQRLEAIERELVDVRRWLERLYRAIETTDLEVSDIAPRIREHRERQERLEAAAGEARALLSERRVVLDDLGTITAYAKDMRGFLRKSELTETRSFINSFVKDIVVSPGKAAVHYTVPMPQGSRVPGLDAEDVALRSPVLSTVKNGGPNLTVASTTFELVVAL